MNMNRVGKWNMRGGRGNMYLYIDADHKRRMGHCAWLPEEGDLCLRVCDSGDCFHSYIALRETEDGKWKKAGEFGAYAFGEVVSTLNDQTFRLACAGESVSLPTEVQSTL